MPRLRRTLLLLLAVSMAGYGLGGGARLAAALLTDAETAASTFGTASSFGGPIAFVKTVGAATCGGTASVITVPAGGVAAGNTVIIRLALRGASAAGAVAATDAGGNVYSVDANSVAGNTSRTVVLSARVSTALAAGSTLTVTHPDGTASAVGAGEFSGLAATNRVDTSATTTGASATPSATVTTTAGSRLLFGAVGGLNNRTWTEAAGWTGLSHLAAECGGAPGREDNHGAFRIVSTSAAYAYAPVRSHADTWTEVVVAYK